MAGRPLARARARLAAGTVTTSDLVTLYRRDRPRLVAALDQSEPNPIRREELLDLLDQLATGTG